MESITEARGLDVSALLRQRLDFILVAEAAEAGEDLSGLTRQQLRVLHRKHLRGMPEEYHALSDILRWVEQGGRRPALDADHPAAFYTLRAAQTPDKDLVNMLLAELCPLDVRQLHICHKQAFYDAYMTWPGAKRDYERIQELKRGTVLQQDSVVLLDTIVLFDPETFEEEWKVVTSKYSIFDYCKQLLGISNPNDLLDGQEMTIANPETYEPMKIRWNASEGKIDTIQ